MADGERIAKAYVEVGADLAKAELGLNQLEPKVSRKILEIQQKANAQLARNKLEMKVAVAQGDFREIDRLNASNVQLRATIEKVNQAALNQAAALRGIGTAASQAAAGQRNLGDASQRAGKQMQQSSGNAAMGLLMVSQFADDMQYGFRSVVNNIPSLGMAIGSMFGMSAEAAMKFGAVLGIVAVGVNLLITHWDDLMSAMGMGKVLTEAEQMEKLAKATKLTADEQERLNRFKKEEAVRNEMSQKMASGVEKTTAEVKQVIADFGDENTTGRSKLVSGLVQARRDQGFGTKMTDAEEERLRNAETMAQVMGGDAEARKFRQERVEKIRASIQARLDREDVRRAEKTVDTAPIDSERRKQLINEIQKNPGAFPEGAADKLAGVKPALNAADQKAKDLADKEAKEEADHEMQASNMLRERRIAEDSRLANAMMGSVGQKFLKNPEMTDEALQDEVKTAMAKAGVSFEDAAEAAEGVTKNIRDRVNAQITERALGRDDQSQEKAREDLIKEAQARDDKLRPKSEVMSTESYLNKLLVAGLSRKEKDPKEDLAKQQLDVSKSTDKTLDKILTEVSKPQKGIPALVGPGR